MTSSLLLRVIALLLLWPTLALATVQLSIKPAENGLRLDPLSLRPPYFAFDIILTSDNTPIDEIVFHIVYSSDIQYRGLDANHAFFNEHPGLHRQQVQTVGGNEKHIFIDVDVNDEYSLITNEPLVIAKAFVELSESALNARNPINLPLTVASYLSGEIRLGFDSVTLLPAEFVTINEYTGPDNGNFTTDALWSENIAPTLEQIAIIQNDTQVIGNQTTNHAYELYLGFTEGDGNLTIDGQDLIIANNLLVASTDEDMIFSEDIALNGSLTIKNTDLLSIDSDTDENRDFYLATFESHGGENVKQTATGTVTIDNVKTVHIADDFEVAHVEAGFIDSPSWTNSQLESKAELWVDNVETFFVGNDFQITKPSSEFNALDEHSTIHAETEFRLNNITDKLTVVDDFQFGSGWVCSSETDGGKVTMLTQGSLTHIAEIVVLDKMQMANFDCTSSTRIDVQSDVDLTFNNITKLSVADEFIILGGHGQGQGVAKSNTTAVFEAIEQINAEADLEISHLELEHIDATASVDFDATVIFDQIDNLNVANHLEIGSILGDSNASATYNLKTTLEINNSAINVGAATLIGSMIGSSITTQKSETHVTLTNTTINTDALYLGYTNETFIAEGPANLTLTNSYITADELTIGERGKITLHIDSVTTPTLPFDRESQQHTQIITHNANLAGTLHAIIENGLPKGTHTLNLIVTHSDMALDTAEMTFSTETQAEGIQVDAFGVTETNGVDTVQLILTCEPNTGDTCESDNKENENKENENKEETESKETENKEETESKNAGATSFGLLILICLPLLMLRRRK
ncbi:MAG: hypothetical protein OXE99_06435 [Cellvibrionales bacterium]|nr:hypothetical protein [Cellvibrionales bacterium]